MVVAGTSPGSLAVGIAGAVIAAVGITDLFFTLFNYDGFTFLSRRFQRALWGVIRSAASPLPDRMRHSFLSVGSASLLPTTVALWLGLEITGFALMFSPGLRDGSFHLTGADRSLGTAFYLSAGDISSLTFGDVVARGALYRALVDLETIVGLATFTLALGYVVTAFDALGKLENLHGRVRRHAEHQQRPSSILARHFRGGEPNDLPSFLQALGDDLEDYDQGLRRYPVVFYFHTRRMHRSIPSVFAMLGDLLALLRWGLPSDEPITLDPFLNALIDSYEGTLERLRLSFAGPRPIEDVEPASRERFEESYAAGGGDDRTVRAFVALERRARESSGRERTNDDIGRTYERYRHWLSFAHRQRAVLDRVADALGYARPEVHTRTAGSASP
jgi:hypothetical protein